MIVAPSQPKPRLRCHRLARLQSYVDWHIGKLDAEAERRHDDHLDAAANLLADALVLVQAAAAELEAAEQTREVAA